MLGGIRTHDRRAFKLVPGGGDATSGPWHYRDAVSVP